MRPGCRYPRTTTSNSDQDNDQNRLDHHAPCITTRCPRSGVDERLDQVGALFAHHFLPKDFKVLSEALSLALIHKDQQRPKKISVEPGFETKFCRALLPIPATKGFEIGSHFLRWKLVLILMAAFGTKTNVSRVVRVVSPTLEASTSSYGSSLSSPPP